MSIHFRGTILEDQQEVHCKPPCTGVDIMRFDRGLIKVWTLPEHPHLDTVKCPVYAKSKGVVRGHTRSTKIPAEATRLLEIESFETYKHDDRFFVKLESREDLDKWRVEMDQKFDQALIIRLVRPTNYGFYVRIGCKNKDCNYQMTGTIKSGVLLLLPQRPHVCNGDPAIRSIPLALKKDIRDICHYYKNATMAYNAFCHRFANNTMSIDDLRDRSKFPYKHTFEYFTNIIEKDDSVQKEENEVELDFRPESPLTPEIQVAAPITPQLNTSASFEPSSHKLEEPVLVVMKCLNCLAKERVELCPKGERFTANDMVQAIEQNTYDDPEPCLVDLDWTPLPKRPKKIFIPKISNSMTTLSSQEINLGLSPLSKRPKNNSISNMSNSMSTLSSQEIGLDLNPRQPERLNKISISEISELSREAHLDCSPLPKRPKNRSTSCQDSTSPKRPKKNPILNVINKTFASVGKKLPESTQIQPAKDVENQSPHSMAAPISTISDKDNTIPILRLERSKDKSFSEKKQRPYMALRNKPLRDYKKMVGKKLTTDGLSMFEKIAVIQNAYEPSDESSSNIADSVKARHIAKVVDSAQSPQLVRENDIRRSDVLADQATTSNTQIPAAPGPKASRTSWTNQERRLFFQALRLYGKNFTEITKFMCSRPVKMNETDVLLPSSSTTIPMINKTRDQIRFLYQQTWYKIRRFTKLPDIYPHHVKELYALINYSVLKSKVKKPLDAKLGEKLTELILSGSTTIRQAGKTIILRTPICPTLKKLNDVSCPTHTYRMPEDVTFEIVPCSQNAASLVLETENNPRIRMNVDINRQLCDLIAFLEAKWSSTEKRICRLLDVAEPDQQLAGYNNHFVALRINASETAYGAVRISEVAKTRSCDLSLNSYLERNPPSSNDPKIEDSSNAISSLAWETAKNIPKSIDLKKCFSYSPKHSDPHSSSQHILDLKDLIDLLKSGIHYENSRDIKVLSLYLALGCPEKISLQYDIIYLQNRDCVTPNKGQTEVHTKCQYTTAFADPGGLNLSNGLRRLLHLSACDYLDYAGLFHDNNGHTPMINHFMSSTPVKLPVAEKMATLTEKMATLTESVGYETNQQNGMNSEGILNEALRELIPPTPEHSNSGLVLLSSVANSEQLPSSSQVVPMSNPRKVVESVVSCRTVLGPTIQPSIVVESIQDHIETVPRRSSVAVDVMKQFNQRTTRRRFNNTLRSHAKVPPKPLVKSTGVSSSSQGQVKLSPAGKADSEDVEYADEPISLESVPKESSAAVDVMKRFNQRKTYRRLNSVQRNHGKTRPIPIAMKQENIPQPAPTSCILEENSNPNWSNISAQTNDTLHSLLNSVNHRDEYQEQVIPNFQIITPISFQNVDPEQQQITYVIIPSNQINNHTVQ
ncbi:Crm, cramped-like [Cichlidogyrus casuarinus]|uniref:Crm, cramped-like n=1 Tax=Cichlidogyrus casuarinus TaxID=1844966 RepID=A0ABD2Q609_9PLAT